MIGEIMSGGSFYSQNSLVLHFGLGKADIVDQLEIGWPSETSQSWKKVAINRKVVATEGSQDLTEIKPANGPR